LADIISIGTAVPEFCHRQEAILEFMQEIYQLDAGERRKLGFLYKQSEIDQRYSVIGDYSASQQQWNFLPAGNNASFPLLDERMVLYNRFAPQLSATAIRRCVDGYIKPSQITHLITVTCTGMSAPGLDLQLSESLGLSPSVFRTSVNFMGCYAAVHALKLAKMICDTTPAANVVIVATELCTLHFQEEYTADNAASSLLFADGSAAVFISNIIKSKSVLQLKSFYSEIAIRGKQDMAWELSSKGFLMRLSGYIPQLVEEDITRLVENALEKGDLKKADISHWCVHPGGRKILEAISKKLSLSDEDMRYSKKVMKEYGNMSSPTILFVLKEMMTEDAITDHVFGVAFGPGLTMETFIAARS